MKYGGKETANELLNQLLKGIQYGTVLITIHNGKITQIDRTEKVRLSTKNS